MVERLSSPAWKLVRIYVLKRDGKCRMCGETKNLDVHHIIPWGKNHDDSVKNLIALCGSCHKKRENLFLRYGLRKKDEKLIEENISFLS